MEINKEQAFPIYSFSVRWSEDGIQDPNYPNWYKDLPEGRIWNSTSFRRMFKEEKSEKELSEIFVEWWDKYKLDIKNINDVTIDIKFVEFEVWCLTWFEHWTFDVGKSNEEVLRSFEDFIYRKETLNHEYQMTTGKDDGVYCLMGAEDRWRWHGAEPNGSPEDHSPAPCRCKFCKEQGVIRIAH